MTLILLATRAHGKEDLHIYFGEINILIKMEKKLTYVVLSNTTKLTLNYFLFTDIMGGGGPSPYDDIFASRNNIWQIIYV